MMPIRYDPAQEAARHKAERKWRNNAVRLRFLEKRQESKEATLRDANTEIKMAETITNDSKRDGSIKRLESKFRKHIKAMMQGYADRNLALYAASLAHQKNRLLREKLRRLELAAQQVSRSG
jgi:hypothetical protein